MTNKDKQLELRDRISGVEKVYEKLIEYKKEKIVFFLYLYYEYSRNQTTIFG